MASQDGPDRGPIPRPGPGQNRSRSAWGIGNPVSQPPYFPSGGPISFDSHARGPTPIPGIRPSQLTLPEGMNPPNEGGPPLVFGQQDGAMGVSPLANSPNRHGETRPGTAGGRNQGAGRGRGRGRNNTNVYHTFQGGPPPFSGQFGDVNSQMLQQASPYGPHFLPRAQYRTYQHMGPSPAFDQHQFFLQQQQQQQFNFNNQYRPQQGQRPVSQPPQNSNHNKSSPAVPSNSRQPDVARKRLHITDPKTNKEVDLSARSPGSQSTSSDTSSIRRQPAQGGPSGQVRPVEAPTKKVLSITSPSTGGPSRASNSSIKAGGPSIQPPKANTSGSAKTVESSQTTGGSIQQGNGPIQASLDSTQTSAKLEGGSIADDATSKPQSTPQPSNGADTQDASNLADRDANKGAEEEASKQNHQQEEEDKRAAKDKVEAEQKAADEKSKAEQKLAVEKAEAEQKAAKEKAEKEKADLEKAERQQKLEAEKRSADEKTAAEKAALEKHEAEKAASEKLKAEKLAAEKEKERIAAEKAAADKAKAQKAEDERLEAEKLAQEKAKEEENKRKEAEAHEAEERRKQEAAEAKEKEEAETEAKAVEEAAAVQKEAAAAPASKEEEPETSSEPSKTFVPPKKKGKKFLSESIAKREAAEAEDMMSAYATPQVKRDEPKKALETRSSAKNEVPPPPERSSPQAQSSDENDNWEDIENPPAPTVSESDKRKYYSKDFLVNLNIKLKDSGAVQNWRGVSAIEIMDVLLDGKRLQTAKSGPKSGVASRVGDKWAQKGPLPNQAGQAPGLSGSYQRAVPVAPGRNDGTVNGADNWRRRDPLPPAPPPMRFPELHKASNRFQRGKLISENPEEELRQKNIKSLLNKVTPEKYELIFEKLMQAEIPSPLSLSGLIDQVYEKGVTEPTFTELYAKLCFDLSQRVKKFQPEPGSEEQKEITFRRLLLNKCQEEFTEGARAIMAVKNREATDAAKEADKGEEGEVEDGEIKAETIEDKKREAAEAIAEQKARRRALGNMQFVGFLYKHRLIAEKIMHECIRTLLEDIENPRREDIECLCKLISTIGMQLDAGKQNHFMGPYFDRMERMAQLETLEARLKFMIQDVIDLRRNGWQERRKVEGPKTIEEIHRDARMEQMAAQRQDFRSQRSGPLGSRGSFRDNNQMAARPIQSLRRHDDRLEAPPRPMQRIPSQEAFAPGGRSGGMFRPGGMLSNRNQSPATRDQATAPTQAAPSSRPSEQRAEAEPVTQTSSIDPEDAKIKGWDDLLIQYSKEKDLEKARRAIQKVLIPHASRPSQVFDDIFLAAVEKKEVKPDIAQDIFELIVREDLIQRKAVLEGVNSMLEAVADAVMDAPFVPTMVGNFAGALVVLDKASVKEVGDVILQASEKEPKDEENLNLLDSGDAVKILASMLKHVTDQKDKQTAKTAWSSSGLQFSAFLAEMDRKNEDRELGKLRDRFDLDGVL